MLWLLLHNFDNNGVTFCTLHTTHTLTSRLVFFPNNKKERGGRVVLQHGMATAIYARHTTLSTALVLNIY